MRWKLRAGLYQRNSGAAWDGNFEEGPQGGCSAATVGERSRERSNLIVEGCSRTSRESPVGFPEEPPAVGDQDTKQRSRRGILGLNPDG